MKNNFSYYVIENEYSENYTKVKIIEKKKNFELNYVSLKILDPIPLEMIIPDYFENEYCIFSEKLYNVLKCFNFEEMKFIEVNRLKNKYCINDRYWCLLIKNNIEYFDNEEYQYIWTIEPFEKYILDINCLKKIPLKKRLIFKFGELPEHYAFHRSIVKALEEEKQIGIKFIPIENNKIENYI